jgi:hypothetical protein
MIHTQSGDMHAVEILVQTPRGSISSGTKRASTKLLAQQMAARHLLDDPQDIDEEKVLAALRELASREPPRALLSVRTLRTLTDLDKRRFDQAALRLSRAGKLTLHHHDFPESLSDDERAKLILDEHGLHYVGIAPYEHTTQHERDTEEWARIEKRKRMRDAEDAELDRQLAKPPRPSTTKPRPKASSSSPNQQTTKVASTPSPRLATSTPPRPPPTKLATSSSSRPAPHPPPTRATNGTGSRAVPTAREPVPAHRVGTGSRLGTAREPVPSTSSKRAQILEAVRSSSSPISANKVAATIGGRKTVILEEIRRLLDEGLLLMTNKGLLPGHIHATKR